MLLHPEGVWALEVSNTGSYSARQPVTREVCINTNSITQIDNAVLFATNRGIMLISGSTVQCISESLNAEDLFSISDLPRSDKLLSVYNGKASENERTALDDIAMIPFFDFLAACRMIYDYTNQHIIVYNSGCTLCLCVFVEVKALGNDAVRHSEQCQFVSGSISNG